MYSSIELALRWHILDNYGTDLMRTNPLYKAVDLVAQS